MIRREKKTKKTRAGRDDGDDAASMVSDEGAQAALEASSRLNADGEEMSPEDRQDEMVEQLAEKRASTRMAALTRMTDQLQTTYSYDFVSERLSTLQMYLLASIRKGDTAESVLACRALSLVALTLGADSESMQADAVKLLSEIMRNSAKSGSARSAVAEALGFVAFIGSSNDVDTLAAMAILSEQLKQPNLPEALASSAWEAWGLLASTLPTHRLAGDVLEANLPAMIKYLDHESIDVKTAAGECIALLWEAKQAIEGEAAEGEDKEEEAASAAAAADDEEVDELDALPMLPESAVPTLPSAAASSASPASAAEEKMSDASSDFSLSAATRSPAIVARKRPVKKATSSRAAAAASAAAHGSSGSKLTEQLLIEKFSALAKDSSRSQSKKHRATQKKTFREFLRTVEDGDAPEESLKIEKSRHEFAGWSHILQLDAIRDVVGKGLNTHFVHNEVIRDVFDLFIESGDGVDDPNRKAASRAQSKVKARENYESRAKSRSKKTALANSFGAEE